jgi:hypothetical protein
MINNNANILLPKFNSKQLINEDNNNEVKVSEEESKIFNLSGIVNFANLVDLTTPSN